MEALMIEPFNGRSVEGMGILGYTGQEKDRREGRGRLTEQ